MSIRDLDSWGWKGREGNEDFLFAFASFHIFFVYLMMPKKGKVETREDRRESGTFIEAAACNICRGMMENMH
jgi:hypothetical protein